MKKLLTFLIGTVLFAQTGNVYLTTPEEKLSTKTAYDNYKAAEKAWNDAKASVKKAHGIKKESTIDFNKEFTTFTETINIVNGSSTVWYSNQNYCCGGSCANCIMTR